jgi:predicted PurR-regulated permease PerM
VNDDQTVESPKRFDPSIDPRRSPRSALAWALAIMGLALFAYVARHFMLLLVLSATLAYVLNPLVKIAESAVVKRHVAVALIYLGIGFGVFIASSYLYPHLRAEVDTLTTSLPFLAERLDDAIDDIQNEIAGGYPAAERWFTSREIRYEKLNAFIAQQISNVPALLTHVALLVLAAVLIPFFSYFFLRDSRKMIQFVLDRLPARQIETSVAVFCEIDRIVGQYLRGVAIEGMVVGVTAGVGLWLLGIHYPLLLGVFSGMANVVPYAGPIAGGSAAMLVALIQFKSLAPLTNVLLLYAFIKLVDVVAIQPIALGGGKELHPALLVGSIIVGGQSFGIIGMIIAVPAITIIQKIALLLLERRRYSPRLVASRLENDVAVQPYIC